MRVAPALVLSVGLAAACAAPRTADPPRRVMTGPSRVGLEDQDALIEVARGARVQVSLEADRTSKRRWHLESASGAALAPHGSPWYAGKHAYSVRELGHWNFDLDAVASGRSTVRFSFRRDDEPDASAERRASFEFAVR